MKKLTIFVLLSFLMFQIGNAQVIERETIENDGVETTITNSQIGMYDGTTNKKAQESFDKAVEYSKKKDSKNAIKYYLKAIKADPEFVEAYDNVGRLYRGEGDLEKAKMYYKKSIELYPEGIMAHQNLAVVYGFEKNNAAAAKEYETIVKLDPNNPEGYFGLANTQMMDSNFEPALENAKKALKMYEETDSYHLGDGYYMCGLISYYSGQKEEAKTYLLQAESNGAKVDPILVKELDLDNASLPKKKSEKQPTKDTKDDDVSESLKLKTEEDFRNTEALIVKAATWLEKTPIDKEPQTRKEIGGFVVKWISEVPYLSVELSQETIPYMECVECLTVFLGNYAKHAVETKNYKDQKGSILAGTESVIRFYKANNTALGKNKEIEKLIKLQDKNELDQFIKGK